MFTLSIIIPFYKGENYIGKVVSSIRAASCNEAIDYEMIVIIDSPESDVGVVTDLVKSSSKGDTNIKSLKILSNNQNIGVAATRNRGLSIAQGEYLYCIDQDDAVEEDFFKVIVPLFHQKKDLILLNGLVSYTHRPKVHRIYYLHPRLAMKNIVLDDIVRSPGQLIFSRKVTRNLKYPVPEKNFGSDDKFFLILVMLENPGMQVTYVDQPVYHACIHHENYSHDRIRLQLSSLELWDHLQTITNTTSIKNYINRNKRYLKFSARSRLHLTAKEWLLGLREALWYFTRPNKIVRYLIKHS